MEGPIDADFGLSYASVYVVAAFFLTNHLVQLEINNDTVLLTFITGAKSATLYILAGFHRTLVLAKFNADHYNAFTEDMLRQLLYTTER